jgi:hypothetical protein
MYTVLRKAFFLEPKNQYCHAHLSGCTGNRQEYLTVHHKKGRGKYFLDVSTWLSACFNCHQWIETHPEEAKELGLSESRLS